jgi:hypothetical protein
MLLPYYRCLFTLEHILAIRNGPNVLRVSGFHGRDDTKSDEHGREFDYAKCRAKSRLSGFPASSKSVGQDAARILIESDLITLYPKKCGIP